ncbi:MAG: gamma-glutamyl-gamma-aminobutyrate hydrolase family protein [Pseudomonadota bacterium]
MMRDVRPTIGVTKPVRGDVLAYLAICFAVRIAGGRPQRLTTGDTWREAKINGLVLGGGGDIFPGHYGQAEVESASYDKGRDEMEMYWARKARDTNLPTLAICRGAQLLNVAHGGTLYQSIAETYGVSDYPTGPIGYTLFRKMIHLESDSLLFELLGARRARVNSIHRQAIDVLGTDLSVSAREETGIVQAIEDPEKPYFLGVQFHPEFLIHRRPFRSIFRGLVEASRDYQALVENHAMAA